MTPPKKRTTVTPWSHMGTKYFIPQNIAFFDDYIGLTVTTNKRNYNTSLLSWDRETDVTVLKCLLYIGEILCDSMWLLCNRGKSFEQINWQALFHSPFTILLSLRTKDWYPKMGVLFHQLMLFFATKVLFFIDFWVSSVCFWVSNVFSINLWSFLSKNDYFFLSRFLFFAHFSWFREIFWLSPVAFLLPKI